MDTYVLTAGRQSQNTTRADFFEPSMKRCGNINWIHHKRVENKSSRSGFGDKDLRDFMVWKFSCAQHTCSTLPKDATIVVSDMDIVWRSSAFEEMSTYAEHGVYAMRENEQGDLSAGLLVSKNTATFQWLLYRCHNYLKHHSRCNADDALREVGKNSVKTLPVCFANPKTQTLTPISQVQCFRAISSEAEGSQHATEEKSQILQRWFEATNLGGLKLPT